MLSVFIDNIKYLMCNYDAFNNEYSELITSLVIHWIEKVKNLLNYLKLHGNESILKNQRFISLANIQKLYFK